MASHTVTEGVIYKAYRGPLHINLLDVDLNKAPVAVRPVLAGESFNCLADVRRRARESHALAAINANYFKTNGTPLGTLIIDGEWVSGPLYNRISMGITENGQVKFDRVNLWGTLESSNPQADNTWVNNINQPRRHGSRLIVYTRRWGSFVRMAYAGSLVAVNNQGEVVDTATTEIGIPWGGYVLSDTKESKIAKLGRGDSVKIDWHTNPGTWQDVVQAVSGGPMLIKDGHLYVDLKDEKFRLAWTSSKIHARTAIGVTADHHLLMATIEGPHTLWDFAKFLKKLGAIDAMNLDGGGSTTMVVEGKIVTGNARSVQRRVASSLDILQGKAPTLLREGFEPIFGFVADTRRFSLPINQQLPAAPGGAVARLQQSQPEPDVKRKTPGLSKTQPAVPSIESSPVGAAHLPQNVALSPDHPNDIP